MVGVYGHFQRSRGEMKDVETPFRHVHAESWTQVFQICGSPRYQVDYGGALLEGKATLLKWQQKQYS